MSTLKVDAIGKFDTTANAITFDSNNNASFTGSVNATNPMMNRNLLINGGMNVWQRSTSETGKSTTDFYTVDRWRFAAASAGTWTLARSTDVPSGQGFAYSYKLDCTTSTSLSSGSILQIQQRIEGQNLQHLLKGTSSSKKLTLSFWVKSNKTGTYIALLFDNDNTRVICKSYTIDAANTWEKKELTFDGDTTGALDNDNEYSLSVALWLVAGSNYTSGTLQTTWGSSSSANQAVGQTVNLADSTSNEILLTGFQLETGSQATNFEFEPYETTLRKCQRYFYRNGAAVRFFRADQRAGNGQMFSENIYHPVPMRSNPLFTWTGTVSLHKHWIRFDTSYSNWGQGLGSTSSNESIYPGTNDADCQMMSFEGISRWYNAEMV